MAEVLSNYQFSSLDMAAGLAVGATTITVIDGSGFPSSGNFRVQVEGELMLCTARSGNDLTVTRGIEGTTPASHSAAVLVQVVLTAGAIVQYVSEH